MLRVESRINFSKCGGMETVYTEYNLGRYARSFALSDRMDQERIVAQLEDGALTLTLPKTAEARPRRIAIGPPCRSMGRTRLEQAAGVRSSSSRPCCSRLA